VLLRPVGALLVGKHCPDGGRLRGHGALPRGTPPPPLPVRVGVGVGRHDTARVVGDASAKKGEVRRRRGGAPSQ
jgi:hypothetical protein